MKTIIRTIILTFLFFQSLYSYGGIVDVNRVEMKTTPGNPVIKNNPSSNKLVLLNNPAAGQIDLFRKGVLTVGIDHHYVDYVSQKKIKIDLKITTYSDLTGGAVVSIINKSVELNYFPNDSLSFKNKFIFEFNNIQKYNVEITGIKENGVDVNILTPNVYVYLDLFADRIENLGGLGASAPTGLSHIANNIDCDIDGTKDELEISWAAYTGAEEYQLEWTFVNDYTGVAGVYESPSNLPLDFRINSTRISTTALNYKITLAFDHGYIFYRLRAVGRKITEPSKKIYSVWTSVDVPPNPNTIAKYYNSTPFEVKKNWQYSATYAEEGKKKEVVTFFDGTLRNRQMVTRISSDGNTIIGETIYDHEGRPVIQVLPTPAPDPSCSGTPGENSLHYYASFSKDGNNQEFEKSDFDVDVSGQACEVASEAMSTAVGASNYYSPSNPDLNVGQVGYIPNANGFPYSQVEYTPDNTGRIRRQGGVGPEFQLNEHSTQYYYSHPFQVQLNNLFGAEVGNASHYQKNMVVDANGQVSVKYSPSLRQHFHFLNCIIRPF